MIRKDRGDGHLYEFANPRLSLLYAKIEFINAISATAPEVFERLHTEPLEDYKESGLLKLRRKQRVEFWLESEGRYLDRTGDSDAARRVGGRRRQRMKKE